MALTSRTWLPKGQSQGALVVCAGGHYSRRKSVKITRVSLGGCLPRPAGSFSGLPGLCSRPFAHFSLLRHRRKCWPRGATNRNCSGTTFLVPSTITNIVSGVYLVPIFATSFALFMHQTSVSLFLPSRPGNFAQVHAQQGAGCGRKYRACRFADRVSTFRAWLHRSAKKMIGTPRKDVKRLVLVAVLSKDGMCVPWLERLLRRKN